MGLICKFAVPMPAFRSSSHPSLLLGLAVSLSVLCAIGDAWSQAAGPAGGSSQGSVTQVEAVAVAPPDPGLAPVDKARAVLETHCARCHQSKDGAPATSRFDGVLAFDDLIKRSDLIQPGRPDASRLYHVLLSGHVPQEVFDAANPAPTVDQIDEVRAWIEGLTPSAQEACAPRRLVTLADQARVVAKLRDNGGDALKTIRFISLARDRNSCGGFGDAGEAIVRKLISAMRGYEQNIDLPLAADDMPMLAVRLGDLGWDASQWDALAALAGAAQLTDDALLDAYGTTTPLIDAAALAAAAQLSGDYPGLRGASGDLSRLIGLGQGQVDLVAASADVGLPASTTRELLSQVKGASEGAASALQGGTISQAAWRALRGELVLPGEAGALSYVPAASTLGMAPPMEVFLWPSAASYKKDDLVVITVQPNRDCNLTVVNVDTRGEATVLFPSDSDPDNTVKAGTKVRIPSDIEPYQLRASERGTESFVAICALNRKRLLGVDQDFEKQRFSLLGDWRTFLKTAATRETLVGRRDTPRQRRARVKAAAAEATVVKPPEEEARAAIYVKIE